MSPTSCSFKMDPAPVFLFAYIAGTALCSLFVGGLAVFDPSFQQAKLSVVLETIGYIIVFFGPPYAALCALVLAHYFKYTVTPEGIGGQNLMGKSTFVAWGDVRELRPARIGNLAFARLVSAEHARPVWLPLFVRNEAALDSSILQWSPKDHVARSLVSKSPAFVLSREPSPN